MNYFNVNTKAIYTHKIYLDNVINNNVNETIKVFNELAGDGNLFMYIQMADGKIIRINSMYSPVNEASIWAKNIVDNYDLLNICVLFGFGNGYCVREILSGINKDGRIIIYEPSIEIFISTLNNYDVSDILIDNRVLLLVGTEYLSAFKEYVIETVRVDNINYVHTAVHPQYDLMFKKESDRFQSFILQYIDRMKVSQNTMNSAGKRLVENQIYSLKHLDNCNILHDMAEFVMKNDTAIIVSAGPSLKKNMDFIKDVNGKALVIAVDRTIDLLLKHDIIPDIVVSVDPIFSLSHIENDTWKTIPLMCSFDTNADIIRAHPDKRIYFDSPKLPADILTKEGKNVIKLERGGSVATAAFMAVIALGYKNIILCGQDLAYGEGDVTHSDGTSEKVSEDKYKDIMVQGINGDMIKCRSDWKTYLDFFEDAIMRNPDVNVIDATEGGALIRGTIVMALKDAISKYCTKESRARQFVTDLQTSFSDEDIKNIKEHLLSIVNDINMVRSLSKSIVKTADKLLKMINDGRFTERSEDVKMFNQYVSQFNSCSSLTMIIMYSANDIKEYIWNLYTGEDDDESALINMYEKYKYMFSALQGKLDELTKLIYN